MGSSYRVLARDGAEYGPAPADTLHEWYRNARIGNDSLACEDRTSNWRRLDEIFDLSTWILDGSEPDYTPRAPKETVWDDDKRTSGMLAAAILLFINAAFSIVQLVLISFQLRYAAETITGTFVLAAIPTMDIIVGVGLLRGRWQWRVFAMILAFVGLALMVIRALYFRTPGYWIEAAFQLVFLVGMITLLYGKPPSRERLLAGVITVVLAWFGAAGGAFVEESIYTPVQPPQRAALAGLNDSGGTWIEDDRDGYKLNLPYEWDLLQENAKRVAAPGAALAASNDIAGCFISLRVEVRPSGEITLDQYLTQLIESQKRKTPTIREIGRSAVTIGSREARRLETYWVDDSDTATRGFNTVCRRGTSYYVLSGSCEESTYDSAVAAFNTLEKLLEVRGVDLNAEPYARRVY